MRKLIKPGRITALVVMLVALLGIYVYFLYQVQIVEGTERYNSATAITKDTRTVTAARGNILDRYGRVLVSNKECYNLVIDSTKLFANDDPNAVILELIEMVRGFGDTYTDDLPITTEPPFEYTDMTEIQRTMLEAYFVDKASDFKDAGLPESPSAVELMSYMRTRYGISNEYSAEEMRMIAGLRYSINVRYAVNTGEYVFVQDASMKLISSILENKLNGIEVKRSFTRQYHTENAAHILGYVGLMTQEEYEKYSLLDYANDAMVGKDGVENAFEEYLHGKDGEVEETRNASGTILADELRVASGKLLLTGILVFLVEGELLPFLDERGLGTLFHVPTGILYLVEGSPPVVRIAAHEPDEAKMHTVSALIHGAGDGVVRC